MHRISCNIDTDVLSKVFKALHFGLIYCIMYNIELERGFEIYEQTIHNLSHGDFS